MSSSASIFFMVMSRRTKFFVNEAKKKMDEKSRFGELSKEEEQEIVGNAVPGTTKKSHKVRDVIIFETGGRNVKR